MIPSNQRSILALNNDVYALYPLKIGCYDSHEAMKNRMWIVVCTSIDVRTSMEGSSPPVYSPCFRVLFVEIC